MTSIVIHEFAGMQPRIGDEYLGTENSSDAANCLLLSGELRPLHAPALVSRFYPYLSHQEIADKFGLEILGSTFSVLGQATVLGSSTSAPTNSFDDYIETVIKPTYGLDLWIQGYLGLYNSANDTALSGAVASYSGFPDPFESFSLTGSSLTTAGAAIDPTGTGGKTVGFINPNAGLYTPLDPNTGTIALSPATGHRVLTGTLSGNPPSESTMAKSMPPTPARHQQTYEFYAAETGVFKGWTNPENDISYPLDIFEDGDPGINVFVNLIGKTSTIPVTVNAFPAQLSPIGGVSLADGTIYFSLSGGPSSDAVSGSANFVNFGISVNGHAGGLYEWDTTTWAAYNSDYTFHVIINYQNEITGALGSTLPAHTLQSIWRARGTADASGIEIYTLNDKVVVQHGEGIGAQYVFNELTLSHGTTYQLIVTYEVATQTLRLYANGVEVGSRTSVPAVVLSAGPREYIGRIEATGQNQQTDRFPQFGRFMHLWHTSDLIPLSVAETLWSEYSAVAV